MLWANLKIAVLVFFGWLTADSVCSVFWRPLQGVYYPMTSGRLRTLGPDWTHPAGYVAPVYLLIFAVIWISFIRAAGMKSGARAAALVSSLFVAPFWVIPAVSADMYDLPVNGYWLASMIYSNLSFFVFGFIGAGVIDDYS